MASGVVGGNRASIDKQKDTRLVSHSNKRSVNEDSTLSDAAASKEVAIYMGHLSLYVTGADRRQEPPSTKDSKKIRRRSLATMPDHSLNTARQQLIALIASVPNAKLSEVRSAIESILQRRTTKSRSVHRSSNGSHGSDHSTRQLVGRQFSSAGRVSAERRWKNGKLKLPKLPRGLRWPRKKFSKERKKTGITIEQYLRNEWLPIIRAGFGELRWLRFRDESAARGIEDFERTDPGTGERKRLPDDLHFLREKEVTDRKLALGIESIVSEPRLASTLVGRVRRTGSVCMS
jgi:hypothetical protein